MITEILDEHFWPDPEGIRNALSNFDARPVLTYNMACDKTNPFYISLHGFAKGQIFSEVFKHIALNYGKKVKRQPEEPVSSFINEFMNLDEEFYNYMTSRVEISYAFLKKGQLTKEIKDEFEVCKKSTDLSVMFNFLLKVNSLKETKWRVKVPAAKSRGINFRKSA